MKNVLYISYDGMTDPLGQSQVIPYLIGLAKQGYKITIISAEKSERYYKGKEIILNTLNKNNIGWNPIMYTKKPPVLSTLIDVYKLRNAVKSLMKNNIFDIVHCRSYISPLAGMLAVKRQKAKFVFDMRGFWADERVDGNIWSLKNPIFKLVYKFFKNKEKQYLEECNAIISLTENGKKEILSWKNIHVKAEKITVIPCAADFNHFNIPDEQQRKESREKLGINNNDIVLCYLGSLGTWYMVDEMVSFFKLLREKHANSKFLVISNDKIGNELLKGLLHESVIQVSANRDEVPMFLASADIGISFIKPSFSKISSSPTKMGEMFAMGIPIIVNSGVGDVAEITDKFNAGFVINNFENDQFEVTINQIPSLLKFDRNSIRRETSKMFNLESAIQKYFNIYEKLGTLKK
ncbi:MAG: glycosyltransferase [Bacteroidales bacterium]|nr:glycosyltransferase [Bacteroidales bacterium]